MIELRKVVKTYPVGDGGLTVLDGMDLHIKPHEFTAILGASGSGKSTMLHIMGLIHAPTAGQVVINGTDTSAMNDRDRSSFRGRTLGFVFQSFHLIPHLTVLENVELPLFYQQVPANERHDRARACLEQVNLSHRHDHLPSQLSGGECQRTAIARALIAETPLLFADEPTGNLDVKTGEQIFTLLRNLHSRGKTVVLITHDEAMAQRMDRRVRISDGLIVEDSTA
ncbi:MAG: putative ABC transport system ATP-binding protein [Kiritimatiellia bacterium]